MSIRKFESDAESVEASKKLRLERPEDETTRNFALLSDAPLDSKSSTRVKTAYRKLIAEATGTAISIFGLCDIIAEYHVLESLFLEAAKWRSKVLALTCQLVSEAFLYFSQTPGQQTASESKELFQSDSKFCNEYRSLDSKDRLVSDAFVKHGMHMDEYTIKIGCALVHEEVINANAVDVLRAAIRTRQLWLLIAVPHECKGRNFDGDLPRLTDALRESEADDRFTFQAMVVLSGYLQNYQDALVVQVMRSVLKYADDHPTCALQDIVRIMKMCKGTNYSPCAAYLLRRNADKYRDMSKFGSVFRLETGWDYKGISVMFDVLIASPVTSDEIWSLLDTKRNPSFIRLSKSILKMIGSDLFTPGSPYKTSIVECVAFEIQQTAPDLLRGHSWSTPNWPAVRDGISLWCSDERDENTNDDE